MLKKQKSSSEGSTKRKPWVDPDDAPEMTDECWIASGIAPKSARVTGSSAAAGRRSATKAKGVVTMRLDADVLESYRALGPGWQTQINADLRRARKLKKA